MAIARSTHPGELTECGASGWGRILGRSSLTSSNRATHASRSGGSQSVSTVGGSADIAPVTDEYCVYADDGEKVLRFAFVASVQASASVQPGDGRFDDPAVAAQPL